MYDTARVPSCYLVETVVTVLVLSYLPAWFPLAQFKHDAASLAKYVYTSRNDPYSEGIQSLVKHALNVRYECVASTYTPIQAQRTAQPSILPSTLIEQVIFFPLNRVVPSRAAGPSSRAPIWCFPH